MQHSFESERSAMVERQLVPRGLTDARVLAAMQAVPRHLFVPSSRWRDAYADRALPIAEGQTISQPYMVAASVERLALQGDERVLEVGAGSGYQAAVLGAMVPRGRVVTIERIAALAEGARAALREAGATNVEVVVGDGSLGWPEDAPYDAIVVAAAAPHVPQALIEQLAPGGRLVVPVGSRDSQRLVTITRTQGGLAREESDGCVYVPLVGADAFPR